MKTQAHWLKRHPIFLWHATVTTASTMLFAVAWLFRDRSGEVDVTAILAGIPIWLMAAPWAVLLLVGAPFTAMVALAWANVGVHFALAALWDRRHSRQRRSAAR